MEDKTSTETLKKGQMLFEQGKVKKELETDKRIHLKVQGETDTHSVIIDKEKNKFNCDCKYFTLKGKDCSHILAAKFLIESERQSS